MSPDGPGQGKGLRRAVIRSTLRSVLTVVVLTVAYFVLPLQGLRNGGDFAVLAVSLLALIALIGYQVRAILRAHYPGLRAMEALAFTAALLLFVFAVAYDVMDADSPTAFNATLSRLDCLYFTVTVFGTVGFGDITAHSQAARAVVTVQMLFDFLFLGVAVRVISGAVQLGRRRVSGGS